MSPCWRELQNRLVVLGLQVPSRARYPRGSPPRCASLPPRWCEPLTCAHSTWPGALGAWGRQEFTDEPVGSPAADGRVSGCGSGSGCVCVWGRPHSPHSFLWAAREENRRSPHSPGTPGQGAELGRPWRKRPKAIGLGPSGVKAPGRAGTPLLPALASPGRSKPVWGRGRGGGVPPCFLWLCAPFCSLNGSPCVLARYYFFF